MTIVINGTTGISGVDGSAATPAVQGADTNTGVFYPAADTVGLATNGTERMRVDSSGNVGIGTASPGQKLEVNNGAADVTVLAKATGANYASFRVTNSSKDYSMQIRTDVSNAWVLRDETAGVNRLAVDTGGNVGIGTDSVNATGRVRQLTVSNAGTPEFVLRDTSQAVDSRNWRIFNASNTLYLGTLNDAGTSGTDVAKFTSAGNMQLATAGTKILNSSGNPILQQTGSVLQVVSAFKNDGFSSASTTFVDITGLSVSITPTSTTSKILILVTSNFSANTGNSPTAFNLVRNSTNIATPATAPTYNGTVTPYIAGNISDQSVPWSASFLDSPATTSATTYKVQGRGSAGTFYVNRRATADFNSTSTITVMEIAA